MSVDDGGIPTKMHAIHGSLRTAGIHHAFGGALALAWCTKQARGTIDIDLNVFVRPEDASAVVAALPVDVVASPEHIAKLEGDGQARLRWDTTPIDVFLDTTDYHFEVLKRVRSEPFGGVDLPFLSCLDLAVFKAFFNRTKDWADLEAMHEEGSLDIAAVAGTLATFLGADDERIERLLSL